MGLFLYSSSGRSQNCTVNANVDQTICANQPMNLIGTTAGLITGITTWSQVSGPSVIIVSPNTLNSPVTGYSGGNIYRFRLSAHCADGSLVYDEVGFTVLAITVANAGPDQGLCPGTGAGNLAGSSLAAGETGLWSIQGTNNGVTILNSASPTSGLDISATTSGNTTLRWTITNSNGCASYDEMVISNRGGVTPVTAGPDQVLSNCFSAATSATLAGSYAGNGTGGQGGLWTVVSGPNIPVFTNALLNNTTVSNLVQGIYVFRWTATGPCVNGSDEVEITVPAPTANITTANPSGNQVFCDNRTTALLVGNYPLYANEIVTWTQTGGPPGPVITSPNEPVTTVTNLNGIPGTTYTFTYTISNSATSCSSAVTRTISFVAAASVITAGPDQNLPCGVTSASVTFTFTGGNQTQWRIISGPATPTYPTIPTGFFTAGGSPVSIPGLTNPGTYVIELVRRVNGASTTCPPVADLVNITTSAAPSASNAGTKQLLACNITSTALAGNTPVNGYGTWYQVAGPNTAVISDVHLATTPISGLINGLYIFRWLITGGPGCSTTQSDVRVVVASIIPVGADAGPDATVCYNTPVYMAGSVPQLNETGTWTVTPSAGVIIADVNNPHTMVILPNPVTSYTFTWTITNSCGAASDNVILTTNASPGPVQALAGPDQCQPSGTSVITLSGNDPAPGTGLWTKLTGGPGTITSPTSATTTVTGMVNGIYTFEWAISRNGCAVAADTTTITISQPVTTANAGPDQSVCGDAVTVTGNTPVVGTGRWDYVSGPANYNIISPGSPATVINGLTEGVYVFSWTISIGSCPPSIDYVTASVSTPPTPANAGPDQDLCGLVSTTLAGNTILSGTGLWSTVTGPNIPTFSSVTNPVATLSNLISGTYILRWTSATGPFCPTSSDDVTLIVVPSASAGPDQTYCDVNAVLLTGNPGSTGVWTQSGTTPNVATLTPTGPNTATATGLINGTYTFTYTVPAAGCTTSDDMLVIISGQGTSADAGPDQALCNAASFALAGNTPAIGTGTWTKLSGPAGGSFSPNANSPSATFNGALTGTYIFVWTITSGTCTNADQVRISNSAPPTPANAGPPQTICGTTATMAANNPAVGTGTWSQVSGPNTAVITSLVLPNTTITGLIPGSYVFQWTISNGICPPSSSQVTLTVFAPPTTANAGPDQALCNASATTLSGNPIFTGTGLWTQVSGPVVTFTDPTLFNTAVTGMIPGAYIFQWTSTLAPCTTSDQVQVLNYNPPTTSNAGPDQALCLFTPIFMAANPPVNGTGTWSQVSGPATVTFINPNSPVTQVLGTTQGTFVFRWSIVNGICAASTDDVTLVIDPLPTIANAGPDQADASTCGLTTVTLAGNVPLVGTGQWSIVSGVGGSFSDVNNPASTFTSLPGATTTLRWTISNGPCISSDEMDVKFNVPPAPSNAGSDATYCNAASFSLSGNAPATGTGTWTKVSGPAGGTFSPDANTPNASFTGAVTGTYIFQWTIANAPCTPSTDQVTIVNQPLPTTANAGPNQLFCGSQTSTTMAGNTPGTGTGNWTQTMGPNLAVITTPSSPVTTVTGLIRGTYIFRWTISNGVCTPSFSDVTIQVNNCAPVAVDDFYTTNMNVPVSANIISNDSDPEGDPLTLSTTPVTLPVHGSVVLLSNGNMTYTPVLNYYGTDTFVYEVCDNQSPQLCDQAVVTITIDRANIPPVTFSEHDRLCQGSSITGRNLLANGDYDPDGTALTVSLTPVSLPMHGNFTWDAAGNYAYVSDPVYYGTEMAILSVCDAGIPGIACTNDTVFITIDRDIAANAGPDQAYCNISSTFLVGNDPAPGTGSWSFISGPNIPTVFPATGAVAVATGLIPSATPYVFQYTISNTTCISGDQVSILNNVLPSPASAGPDQQLCTAAPGASTIMAATAPVSGTGLWTQVSGPNTATIASPGNPLTAIFNMIPGTYVFQWAVSNGVCPPDYDQVSILVGLASTAYAGADGTTCEGSPYSLNDAAVSNAVSVLWTTSGTGTFSNTAAVNPVYTPAPNDITNGYVILTMTVTPGPACPQVSDQVRLDISRQAAVTAGPDASVCEATPFTLAASTADHAATLLWISSGTGTFSNTSALHPDYTPGAADITAGFVILTLTATSTLPCTSTSDAMTLSITRQATAYAGADNTICEGSSYVIADATATNTASILWTTSGTGSFDNPAIVNPTYTPGPNDITNGFVILTLSVTSTAPCPGTSDQLRLNISQQVNVIAGPDAAICEGSSFTASASSVNHPATLLWTTSGTGTFDDATLLHPTYTPGAGDIAAGIVTLTLSASSSLPCVNSSDALVLSISQAPAASAGPDAAICEGSSHTLSGSTAQNFASLQWYTMGDGFFNNSTLLHPLYTPGPADILAGTVQLILVAGGNSPCANATDTMQLNVQLAPAGNAGPDAVICQDNPYTVTGAAAANYASLLWTASGPGALTGASTLTPTYTPAAGQTGTVSLTLTISGNAPCGTVLDVMQITINGLATANAGPDESVCEGSSLFLAGAAASNYASLLWTTTGTGTFNNPTLLNPTYTPGTGDITAGIVKLALQAGGLAPCTGVTDSMTLTIPHAPTANAGPDGTTCQGTPYMVTGAAAQYYASILWTHNGAGTLTGATTLTPVYNPASGETGNVTLTLTAEGIGSCTDATDFMIITISALPTADAGPDASVCQDNSYTVTGASATNDSGLSWTHNGLGTLSNANTLSPTYYPAPGETGIVTLTMTVYGIPPCGNIADFMELTLQTAATASAGDDLTSCGTTPVALTSAAVTGNPVILWTTTGSGLFDDPTLVNPVYTPSNSDLFDGSVRLILSATPPDPCPVAIDTMKLTLYAAATVNAGPDAAACVNTPYTVTAASGTNYASLLWTHNGAGTLTGENTLSPVYTPGFNETGQVTLTLTATSNPPCGGASDQMTLSLMIGVVATAGPDGSICEGGTFALSGASAQNYASVSWTTSGSGVFNDPAIVNPVYTPGPGDINAGQVTLTMTVTAPGPCNPVVDQVLLAISKGPVAYAGPDAAVCPGVSYTVSGASATNYTEVSWTTDGNGVLTGDSTLNPTYTPAPGESGTVLLFLTATGTAPCNVQPVRDTMKITVHLPLTVSAGPDQTIPGMTTATLSGTAAGGSGVYAFSWEPKELLVGFTTDHPGTLQLSNDAQFTLTVTDLVTGCSGTDVVNIIIGSHNLPPVAVDDYDTTGVNVPVIIHILSNDYDPDGQINTVVLCGGPYNGGAIINIDRSLTYQPDFNFKGNDSLCYIICDNGNPVLCDTAMVYININTTDPASRLEVYNMISPNGDGSNDRWIIDGIENYPENNVKIFNRWGDRIFAIDDYNNTTRVWEGTDSNGKNVPDGTYYYILTITNGGSRTGWIFVRSGN